MPEVTLPNGITVSGTVEEVSAILATFTEAPLGFSALPEFTGRGLRARGAYGEANHDALVSEWREIRNRYTDKSVEDNVRIKENKDRTS